jgi:beta-glucanase (GH16 family)
MRAESTPDPPWRAVWTASFAGPPGGAIDGRVWEFDTGKGIFGTGEIETNTDTTRNVHVDGRGSVQIFARGHGAPGHGAWTSARIQTRRLFAAPAGREMLVTADIWQPNPAHGLGYWPAFWLLGPGAWPSTGEIDILEDINALSTHSGTLHCGTMTRHNLDGTFGPCHEGSGLGSGMLACPGCQHGFHSYAVVIDRRSAAHQQIRWYFDGRQFYSVSESAVGRAAWTAAVDHGFSIILNVAVGGAYPDIVCRCVTPTAATSSGAAMTVRHLAVYQA